MKCNGVETSTRDFIEIEGDSVIAHIDPVLQAADNAVWIAPGFVDLQVNGFAGVDYNSPSAHADEIARSIRAMFSTGVTRFFPTVITGSPEDMLAALRNLARARRDADRRSCDGGVSRRGSAHLSPRRAARRASGALGASAGFRRVPPLAGRSRGQRAAGHAVTRMAGVDSLYRTADAGRHCYQHRPHSCDAGTDRGRRSRRRDAVHSPGKWRGCGTAPPS